jgi:hypothetical protein
MRTITFLSVALFFITNSIVLAQTDPGTANLTHQWTFDDGTAKDAVATNPVNGVLIGGASVVNKALKLSAQGQYLSFSGASLALNSYTAISQEIWFTSVAGANSGYTMLSYFGNTSGGMGYNYISTSAARGDNVSRTAISNGTYNSEVGANGKEYDDGLLHQMVSVIRADSVILYLDGVLVSKVANTIALSTINTSLALLGKGGYTSDPTWIGSIAKYSIYNKSLSRDEVRFLYQKGAEQTPMITSTLSAFSFDDFYKTETIKVSGLNLIDSISVVTPLGITANPAKLAPNASGSLVVISYDGTTVVDSVITMTSGSCVSTLPVKSYSNSCYSSLYPGVTNLVTNPYVSSLAYFVGWGSRSINTDHAYVYCGATSGKVTGSNAGSLDVSLTGKLKVNTVYRIKAKVYAIGGTFQIGVFGWANGQSDYTKAVTKTGSWQDVDFTLTTGSALGATQGLFFNNYGLSGTTGYIDNWEMYAIPKVYASATSVNFPTTGSGKVAIRGVSLTQDIAISAPNGFSVNPGVMLSGVNGDSLTITYNGSSVSEGYVYLVSGDVKDSIYVKGTVEPTLVTSLSTLSLDEISDSTGFTITGYNITDNVTLTAPEGIALVPSTIQSLQPGTAISVVYDGKANSSGLITIASGTASASVNLLAARNDECFTPLYTDRTNLITDPTCNTYTTDGWGSRSINSDPAYVYCGSRSGKVAGDGSLERNLTGKLKPNTQYRVKAKVYKLSPVKGQNMGNVTYTLAFDSASFPEPYRLIKAAMDSACYYYSKYTPFIENISVYYDAGIPTAQANYHGSIGFGANTTYMWVGTAMHEMAHYFGSGTSSEWENLMVGGVWTGAVASQLIKSITGGSINGDTQHFWPYGINYKSEITDLGTIDAQRQALITHAKIVKAMLVDDCGLPTNNPKVGVGVYGWDSSASDIYNEVSIPNSWQDVDFTFTTGSTLKSTQGVYFDRGTGYIDNWEMYEMPGTSDVKELKNQSWKIYSVNNTVVTELDLRNASDINISIYDLQGRLMLEQKIKGIAGYNKNTVQTSLPEGLYIVKTATREFTVSGKVLLH